MTHATAPTRRYVRVGATADERLRHVGWTAITVVRALGDCWQWNGARQRNGYGKLSNGHHTALAHRLAYETWVGPIPDGHSIRHRCDHRPCINPAHLLTGTAADNHADRVERLRQPHGQDHASAALADSDVAAIRAAVTGRRGEQAALARHYGVSQAQISLIVRGKSRRLR